MSNENKSAPRRPDFEIDYCRMAVWDNRKDGGHLKFSLSGQLKDVAERVPDEKDSVRDNRDSDRRDDKRGSNRDDRSQRDGGPRYER